MSDTLSPLYLAVGALLALGAALALFRARRWPDPRRRVAVALALALVIGGAYGLERSLVSRLHRDGGVVLAYEPNADRAVADLRDRRLDEVRAAAAAALDAHPEEGRSAAEGLRKLRARVRIDRAPEDDAILLVLTDDADAGTLETTLKSLPADLTVQRDPGGRRATVRLPRTATGALREHALGAVADTLRRRVDALGLGDREAVVEHQGRVFVTLPPIDAPALAELRDILGQTAHLAFKLADDDEDFLESAARAGTAELPRGLTFALENAPVGRALDGSTRSRATHYARLVRGEGEDLQATRRRFEAWLATLPVDGDHELAVGRMQELDEQTDAFVDIGWRSYYLWTRTELDGDQVREGRAIPDQRDREPEGWNVLMELTPAGATRFEELTAQSIKRRFAIVLDGKVASAPVVQSRIPGGKATITMGSGSVEQQHHDAQELALVLLSGALPAPVRLDQELQFPASAWKVPLDQGLLGATGGMALALAVLVYLSLRA